MVSRKTLNWFAVAPVGTTKCFWATTPVGAAKFVCGYPRRENREVFGFVLMSRKTLELDCGCPCRDNQLVWATTSVEAAKVFWIGCPRRENREVLVGLTPEGEPGDWSGWRLGGGGVSAYLPCCCCCLGYSPWFAIAWLSFSVSFLARLLPPLWARLLLLTLLLWLGIV